VRSSVLKMVWLFSEGFASFSVSFEVCAYAMIDIVSKVIFSFIVMAGNESLATAPDAFNEYK
jgi:bacteriorhodopsin